MIERPIEVAAAPKTVRGRIIIGGRSLEDLSQDILSGAWDYERNLLRTFAGGDPDPALSPLAAPMLIGLATGQLDCSDLECVRLAASTHAAFEQAILPFLYHVKSFERRGLDVADGLRPLRCASGTPSAGATALAIRLDAMLRAVRPKSPWRDYDNADGSLSVDDVAIAYFLECGVPPASLPFLKIVARLPVVTAIYIDELAHRPNRFIGVGLAAPGCAPGDDLAATGLELIDAGADFATAMMRLALGRVIPRAERVPINAALISGAEYGDTAPSMAMVRAITGTGAGAVDAFCVTLATFGKYHLGALKESARLLACVAAGTMPLEAAIVAHGIVDAPGRIRIAGFGHRFQRRDPRAVLLLRVCRNLFPGQFVTAAALLDEVLGERRIGYINMDGIGAAMGLQAGFPPDVLSVLTLIARAPGIAKALHQSPPLTGAIRLRARSGLA